MRGEEKTRPVLYEFMAAAFVLGPDTQGVVPERPLAPVWGLGERVPAAAARALRLECFPERARPGA